MISEPCQTIQNRGIPTITKVVCNNKLHGLTINRVLLINLHYQKLPQNQKQETTETATTFFTSLWTGRPRHSKPMLEMSQVQSRDQVAKSWWLVADKDFSKAEVEARVEAQWKVKYQVLRLNRCSVRYLKYPRTDIKQGKKISSQGRRAMIQVTQRSFQSEVKLQTKCRRTIRFQNQFKFQTLKATSTSYKWKRTISDFRTSLETLLKAEDLRQTEASLRVKILRMLAVVVSQATNRTIGFRLRKMTKTWFLETRVTRSQTSQVTALAATSTIFSFRRKRINKEITMKAVRAIVRMITTSTLNTWAKRLRVLEAVAKIICS